MAHGLDGQEGAVERQGHDHQKQGLEARQRRLLGADREVRQDQRQHRQRQDHRQVGIGALEVVLLLAVAQRAEQQRQPHQTVQHDHHHREHGVARQPRVVAAVEHQGGDHHHLDGDDRQGQDQRAVGLAELLGQALGVVHDPDRGPENDREQPAEHQPEPDRVAQVREPALAEQQEQCGGRDDG
jgi:hypothetical protein